jgi:glycosyltransferase involved in cell wall biosynthesis
MSVYRGDSLLYFKEAMKSLYSQTQIVDIYVQQDGKISEELRTYLLKEKQVGNIAYLGEREKNKGLAFSLNELLLIVLDSDYEYLARMDADDISISERIALQYTFMEENRDIDVLGGYIEEFSNDGSYHKIVQYPLKHDEMYQFFAKRVPLAHVTAFFRRNFFEKAGFYPVESPTNEDTLLWMRGFKNGCRFANIPEVLVKVRVSSAFFSRRGGINKAWSDLNDRILVIKTLGYNTSSYFYALALFFVNIAPAKIKQFLYKRLR